MTDITLDRERCYRALESRDRRFDGWFIVGVRTTGIYCRPSCPTPIHPKPTNVDYFRTSAAAQRSGLRACKRCRPDASPGSPEWNVRGDLVGRAMRAIADGSVDRIGVSGLASELAVSERHLHRVVTAELGASPLAIARSHRAQTARTLIETTTLTFTDIAFAAGFSSVRQFNDTIRDVFALTPRELRARRSARTRKDGSTATAGGLVLRLPFREPFAADELIRWFHHRAIPGIQVNRPDGFTRTLRLEQGWALVTLQMRDDHVLCTLHLQHTSDLAAAVARCRRVLDLDTDPVAVADVLGSDAVLNPIVRQVPGLRVPGSADGFETAVFAILGQQVSVSAAVTFAGRLVNRFGKPVSTEEGDFAVFPQPETLAEADLSDLGLTTRREKSIRTLASAWTDGLRLGPGADRAAVRSQLLELPGIGPWTADYIAMRALGDPDVFLASDLVVRRGAGRLGLPTDDNVLRSISERWSPWRSYANHYLWESAS